MIVADASPLIVFTKVGRLRLLKELYDEVLIGPVVKEETIDAGKVVRALGVEQLEAAMEDGWLQTVRLTSEEQNLLQQLGARSRLDQGETESIALASVRSLHLLVDDKETEAWPPPRELNTWAPSAHCWKRTCVDISTWRNWKSWFRISLNFCGFPRP